MFHDIKNPSCNYIMTKVIAVMCRITIRLIVLIDAAAGINIACLPRDRHAKIIGLIQCADYQIQICEPAQDLLAA